MLVFGKTTTELCLILLRVNGCSNMVCMRCHGCMYFEHKTLSGNSRSPNSILCSHCELNVRCAQIYPTSTRASGLGIASSFSRLGGVLCPFVAVGLVKSCQVDLALTLFVFVPLGASLATTFFPKETSGKGLMDSADEEEIVDLT